MKFNRTKETYIFYINLKFHSFEEDSIKMCLLLYPIQIPRKSIFRLLNKLIYYL